MKNQTSRILFVFTIMGFVLLGVGCLSDPGNQSNSSQNTSNQNASNQINSSGKTTPDPKCTISEEELVKAIPPQLKDQYKKNFTIDLEVRRLVFKGFVYGKGNVLQQFFNAFDKFRGENCMSEILFQGNTENDKFYWCLNADCSPPESPAPPAPACNVDDIVKNSPVKDQLNKNVFYNYNPTDKLLEFGGYVRDAPKSERFSALFGQLQNEINNGCLIKITFASAIKKDEKTLLNSGFGWRLSCDPLCECGGECRACPCDTGNTNTIVNANGSNSP